MNYVYIVLRHDHEPDELARMGAWTDKERAETSAQDLREALGLRPRVVTVACLPLLQGHS
jgi:hypothetical protein